MCRRAVLLAGVMFCFSSSGTARAQDSPLRELMDREALQGLRTAIITVVGVPTLEEVPDLTEGNIRTDLEVRLRQAGLRLVPTLNEAEGMLTVFLRAMPLNDRTGRYIYNLDVALTERAILQRRPSTIALANVWTRKTFGRADPRDIRSAVRDIADRLSNDYLAANPR